MKQKTSLFILLLILILGFFLRVVNLDKVPNGFFCDEASIGYNAYSLLKTGKDEYGNSYPFFFRCFGDYRNPVTIYLMIPTIALFGVSEFSVRLTSAIAGGLSVFILYLLSKEIFPKDDPLCLMTSLFLAISPWHIHFSRTGFEFIYFPFFFSVALYLFFLGTKKESFLPLSLLFFGITFYTYYPTQFQTPLFLSGLFLTFRKSLFSKERVKNTILSLSIFLICLIPFLIGIRQGTVLTRFQSVSIFREEKKTEKLARSIFTSYLNHFSPDFLFKKGDIDFPGHFISRHSVRGIGELYWFQLPLIILGVWGVWFFKKRRELSFLLWWLALYPLGSIFTSGGPYANRSIIGVIPFQILSAFGFSYLFQRMFVSASDRRQQRRFKSTFLTLFFILVVGLGVAEFSRYIRLYFYQYPNYSSDYWGWQWGPKEIIKYFKTHRDQYDELYMSGMFNAPYIFLKFYDPEGECKNCLIGGFDQFDPSRKQLFALRKEEVEKLESQGFKFAVQKILYYPSGEEAFFIGEVHQPVLNSI